LFRGLDRLFTRWATELEAEEYMFPPIISAAELSKLDYFGSFPHLATFPTSLDRDEQNVAEFARSARCDDHGVLTLTKTSPVREVLTPAACYHFYIALQRQAFDSVRYFTTCCQCFRREAIFVPLERQWGFWMREIVCIGTASEVKDFLERLRVKLAGFLSSVGVPVNWQNATDPFFAPTQNPKFIAQIVAPTKQEVVFDNRLAIASFNSHRTFFGQSFELSRDGEPAETACVAFGLERWVKVFLDAFGHRPADWPQALVQELG
jgi:seryl-tRNA synthetase